MCGNNSGSLPGGGTSENSGSTDKGYTGGSEGGWVSSGGGTSGIGPHLDDPVAGVSAGGDLEVHRGLHEVALVNNPWSSSGSNTHVDHSGGVSSSGGACVVLREVFKGEFTEDGGGNTGWGDDLTVELGGGSGLASLNAGSGAGEIHLLVSSWGVRASSGGVPLEFGSGGGALGDLVPGGISCGVSTSIDEGTNGIGSG